MKSLEMECVIVEMTYVDQVDSSVIKQVVAVENDIGADLGDVNKMFGYVCRFCFYPALYRLPSPCPYTYDWECDDDGVNHCFITDVYLGSEADQLAEVKLSTLFDLFEKGGCPDYQEASHLSLVQAFKSLRTEMKKEKSVSVAITLDTEGRVQDVFTKEEDNLVLNVIVQDTGSPESPHDRMPTMEAHNAWQYGVRSQADRDVVGVAEVSRLLSGNYLEPVVFSNTDDGLLVVHDEQGGFFESVEWPDCVQKQVRDDYIIYLNHFKW
ncbi:hypothetical protein [Vibrio owensii]|uniref:hypothetical protein n=1 Tax=Vibrio owensii TaxID=696485 RepID=UPI0018F154C6|nr:hypothetical protein [Vibrio owensii]